MIEIVNRNVESKTIVSNVRLEGIPVRVTITNLINMFYIVSVTFPHKQRLGVAIETAVPVRCFDDLVNAGLDEETAHNVQKVIIDLMEEAAI